MLYVDNIVDSANDDNLTGDGGDNLIGGGDGADMLSGGGDECLRGNAVGEWHAITVSVSNNLPDGGTFPTTRLVLLPL